MFELAPLHLLPAGAVLAAAGLGFSLSLLFFMDQNISSALVNAPSNKYPITVSISHFNLSISISKNTVFLSLPSFLCLFLSL